MEQRLTISHSIIDGVEQFGAHPEARQQGKEAFYAGLSLEDCPFEISNRPWSRNAWGAGWTAGKIAASIGLPIARA